VSSCGSNPGTSPAHVASARALAAAMHASGTHLVYGGGTSGVMGTIASELVKLSGPDSVTGIIPGALMRYEQSGSSKESGESGVPGPAQWGRTIVVPSMHARKSLMSSYVLSGKSVGSGFIALSGGYGTLEELMEIVTWNQLGIHDKAVILYNVDGYYDGILQWVKRAVTEGFVKPGGSEIMREAKTAEDVIKGLVEYKNVGGQMGLKWSDEGPH
jgi:uncharacterized protein (TIGR00730 family)